MQVKLLKSGCFVEIGQVLEVAPSVAAKLIKDKRAEAVFAKADREERMVPQRTTERMKKR